eukprot:6466794-Amphidinium_carterae.5
MRPAPRQFKVVTGAGPGPPPEKRGGHKTSSWYNRTSKHTHTQAYASGRRGSSPEQRARKTCRQRAAEVPLPQSSNKQRDAKQQSSSHVHKGADTCETNQKAAIRHMIDSNMPNASRAQATESQKDPARRKYTEHHGIHAIFTHQGSNISQSASHNEKNVARTVHRQGNAHATKEVHKMF